MKKCLNCKNSNKDFDKYCRNCGCVLNKNYYYIIINILIIMFSIGILLMVILFAISLMFN